MSKRKKDGRKQKTKRSPMHVLAVYSIKGGVGKTATAVNVAFAAAETGVRTLVWDLDPQAAASFYLGVDGAAVGRVKRALDGRDALEDLVVETPYENIDAVPADKSARHLDAALFESDKPLKALRRALKGVRDDYDLVILDCPPSLSELADTVFAAAHALVVPVIPTTLSARTLAQLRKTLRGPLGLPDERRPGPPIWPFLSMVDRRKSLHRALALELRADDPDFLMSTIPYSALVERMGTEKKPLGVFAAQSLPNQAMRGLWVELEARLDELYARRVGLDAERGMGGSNDDNAATTDA